MLKSGKLVVKLMLHNEKPDSGTGRGCIKTGGTAVLFFFNTSSAQMDKISHSLMQLGGPNPLEECMSQFKDTKVASQRCHKEIFDKKLTKSTSLEDYNLVHPLYL